MMLFCSFWNRKTQIWPLYCSSWNSKSYSQVPGNVHFECSKSCIDSSGTRSKRFMFLIWILLNIVVYLNLFLDTQITNLKDEVEKFRSSNKVLVSRWHQSQNEVLISNKNGTFFSWSVNSSHLKLLSVVVFLYRFSVAQIEANFQAVLSNKNALVGELDGLKAELIKCQQMDTQDSDIENILKEKGLFLDWLDTLVIIYVDHYYFLCWFGLF